MNPYNRNFDSGIDNSDNSDNTSDYSYYTQDQSNRPNSTQNMNQKNLKGFDLEALLKMAAQLYPVLSNQQQTQKPDYAGQKLAITTGMLNRNKSAISNMTKNPLWSIPPNAFT